MKTLEALGKLADAYKWVRFNWYDLENLLEVNRLLILERWDNLLSSSYDWQLETMVHHWWNYLEEVKNNPRNSRQAADVYSCMDSSHYDIILAYIAQPELRRTLWAMIDNEFTYQMVETTGKERLIYPLFEASPLD